MGDWPLLRTEALELRPCSLEDLALVHQLWSDPDVRKFLFDDRVISLEEARGLLERSRDSFASEGYGLWLFFEKASDVLAGFSGLLGSSSREPHLIFGTQPDLWGRGYAREAASAVIRYGFEVLKLPRILADVDEPNTASIRVLEKLGMTRTRRAIVKGRPLLYYEIGA